MTGCEPQQVQEAEQIDEISQNLPSGFTKTRVATGLSLPVGVTFAPDGRMFVIERGTQAGGTARIRIVKNGSLLSTPFASFSVNNVSVSASERGLLGIAFDPDFATNNFVYVYYTATSPGLTTGSAASPPMATWRSPAARP